MSDRNVKIICVWCGKMINDIDTERCSRCGGAVGFTSNRLMNCPACGNREVSFQASTCPKCGHPITEEAIKEYAGRVNRDWENLGRPKDGGMPKSK